VPPHQTFVWANSDAPKNQTRPMERAQNTLFSEYFKIGDGEIKIHKIFCELLCHQSISEKGVFWPKLKNSVFFHLSA
jgi:hypothetical protein